MGPIRRRVGPGAIWHEFGGGYPSLAFPRVSVRLQRLQGCCERWGLGDGGGAVEWVEWDAKEIWEKDGEIWLGNGRLSGNFRRVLEFTVCFDYSTKFSRA